MKKKSALLITNFDNAYIVIKRTKNVTKQTFSCKSFLSIEVVSRMISRNVILCIYAISSLVNNLKR